MAGPWEKYQVQQAPVVEQKPADGPWSTYQAPAVAETPVEEPALKTIPDYLKPWDYEQIATKYGVSAEDLREIAPYYGVQSGVEPAEGLKEAVVEGAKQTVGFAARSAGFNIPQFVYKKLQDEPMRKAIDELQTIANEQQNLAGLAGEIAATPAGIPKALSRTGLRRLASGVGTGAIVGTAQSKEGQEVEGAITGAAIGGVLAGGAEAIGKVLSKAETKAVSNVLKAPDTSRRAEIRLEEMKKSMVEADDAAAELLTNRTIQDSIKDFNEFQRIEPEILIPRNPLKEKEVLTAIKLGATSKDTHALQNYRSWVEMQQDAFGFAKYLNTAKKNELQTIDDALNVINQKMAIEGKGFIRREYGRYKDGERIIDMFKTDIDTKVGTGGGFWSRLRDWAIDGKFAMRLISQRLGVNGEKLLDDMTEGSNKYTVQLANAIKDSQNMHKDMGKANLSSLDLYNALDTGKVDALSPDAQKVYLKYKRKFEEWRNIANSIGIPITKRENYVPKQVVETAEFIRRIKHKAKRIYDTTGIDIRKGLSKAEMRALKADPDFDELKHGLQLWGNAPLNTPEQFMVRYRKSLNPETLSEGLQSKASAALKREDAIPDFLLEKDPRLLMNNWVQNTFRHAYFRDGIAELRRIRNIASAANDANAVKYTTNLIKDLLGTRKGTLAQAIKNRRAKTSLFFKEAADRAKPGIRKNALEFIGKDLDIIGNLSNQVYPNYLGLSIPAAVANFSQPFLMTVPELGYKYGTAKIVNAYGRLIKTWIKGKPIHLNPEMARLLGREPGSLFRTRNVNLIAENMAQAQKQWSTELRNATAKGISDSALYNFGEKALQKMTDTAMFLFEKSEGVNRFVAGETGRLIARDLIAGRKGPRRLLNSMTSEYRRSVEKALKAGNPVEVERLVSNYLISKTIFNYNRQTMSEFGRTVGPLLSVFTKWPTSIAGDIAYNLTTKNKLNFSKDFAYRYLGPLTALVIIDSILKPDREGDDNLYTALVGKKGLTRLTPLSSLSPVAEGKVFQPPLATSLGQIISGLASTNPDKIWKGVESFGRGHVPGASLLKFLTDDIPKFQSIIETGEYRKPREK